MKILQKTKEKLSFSKKIDESLANAIRRSVAEIEILAIDEIEFYKNDSALYDEIIAHRLGLVPLKNPKLMLREKCSCKGKGCSKCSIKLKLTAKGPCTVYSGDLKGTEIVYKNMPVVILDKDQELELVANARLGKAIEHAKFSPGLAYYRHLARIEISKGCDSCGKCIDACPQKILVMDKKPSPKDIEKCDLCEACIEACKNQGKECIEITPTQEIIFFIESFGQMDSSEIFKSAIEELIKNLKETRKQIK